MDLDGLLGKLDLETKVRLLTGASFFTLHGEESIGLRPMAFSDGPTGVRGLKFSGGRPTSLLPNATLIAATWDVARRTRSASCWPRRHERQHIHVVLGPTINLHRSPLGGRLFEAYSEDPLLTGLLAAAYVEGLQSRGVGACLKHLVANESETDRHTVNSVVDEATLREVYLLPFEIAVADADPWSVMAAYNDVNGVPATEQDEVNNGILKDEWGWTGLLMSDWFATKSAGARRQRRARPRDARPAGPVGRRAGRGRRRPARCRVDVVDDHVRRLLVLADAGRRAGRAPHLAPPDLPAPGSAATAASSCSAGRGGHDRADQRRHAAAGNGHDGRAGRPARGRDASCMGGGSAQVTPAPPGLRRRRTAARLGAARGPRRGRGADPAAPGRAGVLQRPGDRRARHPGPAYDEDGGAARTARADVGGDLRHRRRLPRMAPSRELSGRVVVPAGAMTIGVLGLAAGRSGSASSTHEYDAASPAPTRARRVLRPPGWQADIRAGRATSWSPQAPSRGGEAGSGWSPSRPRPDDEVAGRRPSTRQRLPTSRSSWSA